jgi:hypothetical protein
MDFDWQTLFITIGRSAEYRKARVSQVGTGNFWEFDWRSYRVQLDGTTYSARMTIEISGKPVVIERRVNQDPLSSPHKAWLWRIDFPNGKPSDVELMKLLLLS